MILETQKISIDDLLNVIDVDEGVSGKKEVPVNCIFTGLNEITKDTGLDLFNENGNSIIKSIYAYNKKNGDKYLIRNIGTTLQYYDFENNEWVELKENIELEEDAIVGYREYDDVLYMGNGVDNMMSWDGNTFSEHTDAAKGNILEVFEDRLFVAGNNNEPFSIYYSEPNQPTNFPVENVIKILGTDKITGLVKYYNYLIIFKEKSVWRLQFLWEPNTQEYLPKIELVSQNYGCISPKAYCWVENDVWFFTGKEVRRVSWLSGSLNGILGFDPKTLSYQIKDGLEKVNNNFANNSLVFYHDKRFYLSVPLGASEYNNITYVCHILYKNNWTKLVDRPKARINSIAIYNNNVYQANSNVNGTIYRWNNGYKDIDSAINSYIITKAIGDKDFLNTLIFRYLDLDFKTIQGSIDVQLILDDFDERRKRTKSFNLVIGGEGLDNTLGEIVIGELLVGAGYGDEYESTEYLKRRIGFLDKAQSLKIKISNSGFENFILSKISLEYKKRDRKYIAKSSIFNM